MNKRPPSPQGVIEEIPQFDDLKDMLKLCVQNYSELPAFNLLDSKGNYYTVTYREFGERVDQLGTALISLGLKGEKIAIIGENRYEWCITYLAVTNGTGIVVPLDKELPESELANLLNRSEATAIVYSGKLAASIEKLAPFVSTLKYLINMDLKDSTTDVFSFDALCNLGKRLMTDGVRSFIDATITNDELSVLLYTSGTTDLAKGVMLSHKNISFDIKEVMACLYIGSEDSVLSILPLHHTYECTCGFLLMISAGVKISFCEGIKYISKNLKETRPSILLLVPLIVENMYKKIWDSAKKTRFKTLQLQIGMTASNILRKTIQKDIRRKLFTLVHENIGGNLRLVICGAAAIDPKVAEGFETIGITVRQGYGLTESSPILTVNTLDKYRHSSIGLPLPEIEMKINAPDSSGIGEIIAKGDNIMIGYYKNESATQSVLKDGWLFTGDLGYVDDDGFYYITGRQKNVIVTKNGKNIYPEEVETYLNKSPFIAESLVYGEDGVDKSGNPNGETYVKATIFPDKQVFEERFSGQSINDTQLYELIKSEINHVNKMMPSYKRISNFELRETEFEKTTTKKIKRYGQNNP